VVGPPTSVGWEFERVDPDTGRAEPILFTTTGNYSFDTSRDVTRTISGFVLLPEDRAKLNLASDVVYAYLKLDGVRYAMSRFVFTEDVVQKNVVIDTDTNEKADLTNLGLGDRSTLLLRNDGTPQTLYAGFDPTAEMERLVLPHMPISIEASESANTQDVTWDGSTTDLAKIDQLAELAGHRPPWLDNNGVMRSVSGSRIYGNPLEFEKDIFLGDQDSISVTNNYLNIPNRVIVTNNSSSGYQVIGVWDAPASWTSSESQRGYIRAVNYEVQGAYSNADAERIAAVLGRRLSARKLSARILPTPLFDGPRAISYDGALWTIQSWSVDTSPGAQMDFEAEEYFAEEEFVAAPLGFAGLI
jgi:hypothetical protein